MVVVNEAGLNRLIIRSNASNAEQVQDWLTDQVMPAIRRTGQYGSALPASFAEALDLAEPHRLARSRQPKLSSSRNAGLSFASVRPRTGAWAVDPGRCLGRGRVVRTARAVPLDLRLDGRRDVVGYGNGPGHLGHATRALRCDMCRT